MVCMRILPPSTYVDGQCHVALLDAVGILGFLEREHPGLGCIIWMATQSNPSYFGTASSLNTSISWVMPEVTY